MDDEEKDDNYSEDLKLALKHDHTKQRKRQGDSTEEEEWYAQRRHAAPHSSFYSTTSETPAIQDSTTTEKPRGVAQGATASFVNSFDDGWNDLGGETSVDLSELTPTIGTDFSGLLDTSQLIDSSLQSTTAEQFQWPYVTGMQQNVPIITIPETENTLHLEIEQESNEFESKTVHCLETRRRTKKEGRKCNECRKTTHYRCSGCALTSDCVPLCANCMFIYHFDKKHFWGRSIVECDIAIVGDVRHVCKHTYCMLEVLWDSIPRHVCGECELSVSRNEKTFFCEMCDMTLLHLRCIFEYHVRKHLKTLRKTDDTSQAASDEIVRKVLEKHHLPESERNQPQPPSSQTLREKFNQRVDREVGIVREPSAAAAEPVVKRHTVYLIPAFRECEFCTRPGRKREKRCKRMCSLCDVPLHEKCEFKYHRDQKIWELNETMECKVAYVGDTEHRCVGSKIPPAPGRKCAFTRCQLTETPELTCKTCEAVLHLVCIFSYHVNLDPLYANIVMPESKGFAKNILPPKQILPKS